MRRPISPPAPPRTSGGLSMPAPPAWATPAPAHSMPGATPTGHRTIYGQQFRLLGSIHRAAPTVVCAIAAGVGPYELPLNPKSINDALTRMRARGQVFSPEKSGGP